MSCCSVKKLTQNPSSQEEEAAPKAPPLAEKPLRESQFCSGTWHGKVTHAAVDVHTQEALTGLGREGNVRRERSQEEGRGKQIREKVEDSNAFRFAEDTSMCATLK